MNAINYDFAAEIYDKTRTVEQKVFGVLSSMLQPSDDENILEYGCGTGNYIDAFYKTYPKSIYYGIDKSLNMVSIATRKCPYATIVHTEDEIISDIAPKINKIYCVDVLHHIQDLASFFYSLSNMYKQTEFIVICTESHEQLKEKYWNIYFPSLYVNDRKRFHSEEDIIRYASNYGWSHTSTIEIEESKESRISSDLYKKIVNKTLSSLYLISDEEYNLGVTLMKSDYKSGKSIHMNEGYTLIQLRRI